MRDSFRFPIYLRAFGVTREALERDGDGLVIDRIAAHVAASERVSRAVVLALDGVVVHGDIDWDATQVYVPNDFVARETERHPALCFGASVNPHRRDALDRLARAYDDGAVLLKWIPNIMGIDPADEAIRPFYRRLVELGLPLLTHAGQERSFASAVDAYGDPLRLELPLSMGVTVIAAHIATTGENAGEDNFDRILPLFEAYPNLYADVSSLTQINKLGYLARALKVPGLPERLVYGTDWPLQFFPLVSPYYHLNHIGFAEARSAAALDNPWDRDIALKEALHVPGHVFARGAELLPMERCL
ncbi:MAG: amidohydrolase family protein [Gammaproteobacteria bacterium]|nr:amidohydrolase family protein [Gammaproteobacteria bacterium]